MTKFRTIIAAAVMGIAVPCGSLVVGSPAKAQSAPASELVSAVQRYGAAWESRDPDRIAALHTEDSVFHLVIDGSEPAKGRVATRAQFAQILTDNPQYASTIRSMVFGPDFAVIEYDIRMAPPRAHIVGKWRYMPSGKTYALPAIDVIYFKDGLVTRKLTYLDTAVVRANSKKATPAGSAK
jgi:uncharacterized protein (TIGR02246 family)